MMVLLGFAARENRKMDCSVPRGIGHVAVVIVPGDTPLHSDKDQVKAGLLAFGSLFSAGLPGIIQWHVEAEDSPITVAGAAPDFPDSLLIPKRGTIWAAM